MLTIETKSPGKEQKQQGRILNMHSRAAGASISPVIRRLPFAYAMMHNISVNETIMPAERIFEAENHDIYVKVNSILKRIRIKDIYLVEGLCDFINIYTNEKRYTFFSTMYSMLEKLPEAEFMRVHRSYIVRINRISAIDNNRLSVGIRSVPMSKTYKREVMSRLTVNRQSV